MALIGLVDAVTGNFAVTVFYLVPIGLVTFSRGRWVGTFMAATAAFAWSGVELAQKITTFDQSVTYWNWLTRFYLFLAIAILVAPMRDVVLREREITAREIETAQKLRAIESLRAALSGEEEGRNRHLEAMVELHLARFEAEMARGAH